MSDDESNGETMFVTVKFGANETLIVNPYCAVVNLLKNIKRRAGFEATDVTLDLSDETGLIKDLDLHKYDYANKYLTSHATYILVEKQIILPDDVDGMEEPNPTQPTQYNFIPLLEKFEEHFPDYKLRVPQTEKKKKLRGTGGASKSPSPAGRKPKKRLIASKKTK